MIYEGSICTACGMAIIDPNEYHTRESYDGPCTIEFAPEDDVWAAWRFFTHVPSVDQT